MYDERQRHDENPDTSSLTQTIDDLLTDLLTRTGTDDVRSAAHNAAALAAVHADEWWGNARAAEEGPIDVIDMFSGCGGMSAGFRAVNGFVSAYQLAGAVDVDQVANRTYHRNLGLRPRRLDVATMARDTRVLEDFISTSGRRPGHPLVLIGCAPCQGFSSHRNSAGVADLRNSLFLDFARVAIALRPDAIVMENVPELLTEKNWRYIQAGRQLLEAGGYQVNIAVHNMAEYGVPQERYRALILALPRRFHPLSSKVSRDAFRTVRDAIGHLPRVAAGEVDPADPMHVSAGHKPATLEVIRAIPKNGGNRPPDIGPPCLRKLGERQGKPAYEDVYGRLFWDRPAITITAYSRNPASGRFLHPEQDRALSSREAALLQGYPSDYWFEGSLDKRFRQIGNAVPPRFAAVLAVHLLGELLGDEPDETGFTGGVDKPLGSSFARMIPGLKARRLKAHALTGL